METESHEDLPFLYCKVCFDKFDDKVKKPMFLQCGHTFCFYCMKELFQQNKIKCPLDKKVFNFNNMSEIPTNYQIIEAIHPKLESDIKPCPNHIQETLKFYCKTHSVYICQDCLLQEHLGHEIVSADSIINYNELQEQFNNFKQKMCQDQLQIKNQENVLKQEYQDACDEVTDCRKRIVTYIDDQYMKAIDGLKEKFNNFQQHFEKEDKILEEFVEFSQKTAMELEEKKYDEQQVIQKKNWYKINKKHKLKLIQDGFDFDENFFMSLEFMKELSKQQFPNFDIKYQELLHGLQQEQIIKSKKVLKTMKKIDRKNFVSEEYKSKCYVDRPLPIGWNTTISAPHMHANTLEVLKEKLIKGGKALDIGVGSGYLAACMAEMMGKDSKVYGVDHIQSIVNFAENNIKQGNSYLFENNRIILIKADGRKGLAEYAPYDVIHVGGAISNIPSELEDQLAPGGLLWAPVGPLSSGLFGGGQSIYLIEKDLNGICRSRKLFNVAYGPLGDPEAQVNENEEEIQE